MVHFAHGLRIYKKRAHLLITFGILLLPLLFIYLAGQLTVISSRALLAGLAVSFLRLALAYFISLLLALVLAIGLGQGRRAAFFLPVFDLLQNLPSFALIPLFGLWLGYTGRMIVVFAVTSILWPILFNLLTALRTAKNDYNEAATIFGATGWKRIIYYLIPLSFPALLTGSIVGISIGWEAVIGGELIGVANGIGTFLNQVSGQNRTTLLVGITALLFLVFTLNKLIWLPLLKKAQLYAE